MKRLKLFIPLGIFVGLAVLLYLGLSRNPDDLPSALIGKSLPAFALPSLDDPTRVVTDKDLLGQAYILNVWASWCTNCKIELPFLGKLAAQGIKIVGINYKDPAEDAKALLADVRSPYQINIADKDGKLGIDLGVYGAPESFIVDAQGVIREKIVGEITEDNWRGKIAQYFYDR